MLLSRRDFFRALGLVSSVDALLAAQYAREEEAILKREEVENERAADWNMSFHASSFPSVPDACPRKPLYGLMNIPAREPRSRFLRAVMEAGQDIEARIVKRFENAGILLSSPDGGGDQTSFRVADWWLVAFVDAVIRLPGSDQPHVVEIKSKKIDHVREMQERKRGYDQQHYAQIQVYIAMCNLFGKQLWPELKPCRDGTILYVARDDPSQVCEFYVTLDEDFIRAGLAKLAEWRVAFLADELLSRPDHFMWSQGQCKYCDIKKICKADHKAGVTKLSESAAIDFARETQPGYSLDQVREAIRGFWNAS